MDQIKRCVKTLLESQKSISELNKTIKTKRKMLNDSKDTTQRFLQENELQVLDVGSHQLELKERVTSHTLNKDFLAAVTCEFLAEKDIPNEDNSLAHEFVEFVWKKRADKATKKVFLSVKKAKVTKPKKRKVKEISVSEVVEEVEDVEDDTASVENL